MYIGTGRGHPDGRDRIDDRLVREHRPQRGPLGHSAPHPAPHPQRAGGDPRTWRPADDHLDRANPGVPLHPNAMLEWRAAHAVAGDDATGPVLLAAARDVGDR